MTYGNSKARGQIGTAAASLHHSHNNAGSDLHLSSRQCRILNPLREARDGTASSWTLVGFVTSESQGEFSKRNFLILSPGGNPT